MNRIKRWIRERLTSFICDTVAEHMVVGGHCGLCGKWVSDVLLPRDWQWTACAHHTICTFEERQQHIGANIAVAKLAKESAPPTKERNA